MTFTASSASTAVNYYNLAGNKPFSVNEPSGSLQSPDGSNLLSVSIVGNLKLSENYQSGDEQ
jgi:hypothetical protein